MAASRVLSPFVARVVIANPLQVKAIAHAHVKTDKVDAGKLASLYAVGYLPEIWTPDAVTERTRIPKAIANPRPNGIGSPASTAPENALPSTSPRAQ